MGLWSLTSAAVQGTGHKKSGVPCQDKTLCLASGKVRAIALADGAGSAKLSHVGADAVIDVVADCLANHFDEMMKSESDTIKNAISYEIHDCLKRLAVEESCEITDLSSTLLAVAVKQKHYIAIHVGDGVIGCFHRDKLVTLSKPENGEFAHTTWFTTTENLEDVMRVYRGDASAISGFILMSDGVEPSLYDGQTGRLADAVIGLFYANARYDQRMMSMMLEESIRDAIAERTYDDCSIALLSRTRYKNFAEYAKFRKMIAKRERKLQKSAMENGKDHR